MVGIKNIKSVTAALLRGSAVALAVVSASCSDSLEDINKNPNATENPQPAYLLSAVEYHSAEWFWGNDLNYNSTLLWVQHWAKIQYTEPDCYNVSNDDFTQTWNTAYASVIADADAIIKSELSNDNIKNVARIWRAWTFLQLTNLYGNIPYSEYGKTITPKYDAQEEVLRSLLTELTDAANGLSVSGEKVEDDLVFGGNLSRWRKFANSLRLRIALEIADRDEAAAKSVIAELYADRENLISSNDDNARFVFTSSPQWNPWAEAFATRDDQRVSKTLIEKLKSVADPRLPIFAQLPQNENITTYQGAGNGLSADAANSQGFYNLSLPGKYFLADDAPAVFFTYSEVAQIFAESAARGFINADAEAWYKEGIKASLAQYGITDNAVVEAYLSQPDVAYNSSRWAELIGWQKWIAYYGQAPDAFTDWRRLGYPHLVAGASSVLDGDELPRRLFYPDTEQSLNGENYRDAVGQQGSDELTTRLWFDVENKIR